MDKFPYKWKLSDNYKDAKKNGLKVFSCFACGGGSTMGYKLAGYDVIGFNEIDPKMAECYIANHNPKYRYIEPIQEFKNRKDLPEELYNLDILDGSPPCSSFSMAGNREKDWGKKKKFREGQQEQVLDTLFFDFLDLAEELQPKVIVAENVKGLLIGGAADFLANVMERFNTAGYKVGRILLDASRMGVPQKRERVFFYAIRNDLVKYINTCDLFGNEPELNLRFCEKDLRYYDIKDGLGRKQTELYYSRWLQRVDTDNDFSDICKRVENKKKCFSDVFAKDEKPLPTITSKGGITDFNTGHYISNESIIYGGTYPIDYNFISNKISYLVGMSVPPVMTAQIATRIKEQWFDRF